MKRRGVSLNELMVAVALSAILMPLCGKLIWTLANAQRQQGRAAAERRELPRLILRLKSDSLAADRFQLVPPRFWNVDGSSVSYASHHLGVERKVWQGNAIIHRDTFRIGPDAQLEFAADEPTERAALTLTLPRTKSDSTPLRMVLPLRLHQEVAP